MSNRLTPGRRAGLDKFAASDKASDRFLKIRKEREATNLARTLQFKSLRLAKEAQDLAAGVAKPARKPARRKPEPDAA